MPGYLCYGYVVPHVPFVQAESTLRIVIVSRLVRGQHDPKVLTLNKPCVYYIINNKRSEKRNEC